mmetsp:Transcript_38894/g.116970  ORF Transcript_38894/g.116970 Transcript_38894/m.116970 type:complete len:182 (+) Transcript_38894:3206-3751(+)
MVWQVLKMPEQRSEKKPWAERFVELVQFKEDHGHTVVPQHYPQLGGWVHLQRVHYKLMKQGRKSSMTHEKALKLIDIGFVFEVKPHKIQKVNENNYEEVQWERAASRAAALERKALEETQVEAQVQVEPQAQVEAQVQEVEAQVGVQGHDTEANREVQEVINGTNTQGYYHQGSYHPGYHY